MTTQSSDDAFVCSGIATCHARAALTPGGAQCVNLTCARDVRSSGESRKRKSDPCRSCRNFSLCRTPMRRRELRVESDNCVHWTAMVTAFAVSFWTNLTLMRAWRPNASSPEIVAAAGQEDFPAELGEYLWLSYQNFFSFCHVENSDVRFGNEQQWCACRTKMRSKAPFSTSF